MRITGGLSKVECVQREWFSWGNLHMGMRIHSCSHYSSPGMLVQVSQHIMQSHHVGSSPTTFSTRTVTSCGCSWNKARLCTTHGKPEHTIRLSANREHMCTYHPTFMPCKESLLAYMHNDCEIMWPWSQTSQQEWMELYADSYHFVKS